jgi:hypothetical protein
MTIGKGVKVVEITANDGESTNAQANVEDFADVFNNPIDVAVDTLNRLYVADFTEGQVYQTLRVGDS